MKKTKSLHEVKVVTGPAVAIRRGPSWWPWVAALAGLFLVFEVYMPALNGDFVFDDLTLPFFDPNMSQAISGWVQNIRPLLMLSFWVNYRVSGVVDPYMYHVTNVWFHFLTSILIALIAAKLMDWAGVAGRARAALAVFAGGLFLLHPLQTEAVSYVASRSDNLSVLFYFAAFTAFLYRRDESVTILRAVAIVALFGAAVATKEYTLTLPVLLLLTDFFWQRGGIRKNAILYIMLAVAGAFGAAFVFRILFYANTAGFSVEGLSPATYFFTQCRVLWIYLRMFVLPFGQNLDPDFPISRSLFDHGAIFGLLGLVALVAVAWIYRKRYPLAAFGVFVFLLLIAPTSSFVPIKDVLAERRVYLPFLGLELVCLEFLRRVTFSRIVWIGSVVLAVCVFLTYQRNQAWATPLALWQDTVNKSPTKYRPRFQLAFAQYQSSHCQSAAQSYEQASHLGPADDQLLIDWALALDCANRPAEAIAKLREALKFGETAHIYSQIAMVSAKHGMIQDALQALAQAERVDPGYDMTYVYRGNIYEQAGDRVAAARQYQHALELKPGNQAARDALARVSR